MLPRIFFSYSTFDEKIGKVKLGEVVITSLDWLIITANNETDTIATKRRDNLRNFMASEPKELASLEVFLI